jgi:RNA polymerase sigma-70 factor (ECF subfamily)
VSARVSPLRSADQPEPANPAPVPSFAVIYRLHAAAVYRRCLALGGGDRAWAEDVMQDVFVRLHERQASIAHFEAVGAWLLTVADRLCLNRLRRERGVWHRIRSALLTQKPPPAPPPGEDDAEALLAELRESLSDLPEKERVAMIMKYVEGQPQNEIARRLSCSEGYVSKLIARALERLRAAGWESRHG